MHALLGLRLRNTLVTSLSLFSLQAGNLLQCELFVAWHCRPYEQKW